MIVQRVRRAFAHPKALAVMGSAGGQALLFGATAVVSRVFSPDDLSIYGVFFALFNLTQIAAMLRIEQALVYTPHDDEANALAKAAYLVLPGTLAIVGLAAFAYLIANPQTSQTALPLTLALVLALAVGAMARLQTQIVARADAFRWLALLNFLRPAFIATMQLLATLTGPGPLRLPYALTISQMALVAATAIISRIAWSLRRRRTTIRDAWNATGKYIDFVRYNLPQNLLFVASESIVPLSISFLFPDDSAVALFWLASRVVFAPANIFAESIRSQIYRTIARDPEGRLRFVIRTTLGLFVLIGAPVLVIAVAGEPLFEFAFGAKWGGASQYALVLGLLVTVNVSALPLVGAVPVLSMQQHYLAVEFAGLMLRAGLLFLVPWSSPLEAVAATTVVYVLLQLFFLGCVFFKLTRKDG